MAYKRIYFALSGTEVKIGIATDPITRINSMRTARPDIKLLVDISGSEKTEAHLHHRFSQFSIGGEWFRFTEQIQSFVEKELPVFVKETLQWHQLFGEPG
jgi:hypothetical protein